MNKRENGFQGELIKELKAHYNDDRTLILKNDPNYIQGIPDISIMHNDKWAMLECKKSSNEPYRPNQEYYLDISNKMSFSATIYPENKDDILNKLYNFLG